MISERSAGLLWDACHALAKIGNFIDGKTLAEYSRNDLLRSAVERQLEIVGEVLSAVRRLDPDLADRIPNLQRAVGLRNILIYGYATVDDGIVWEVAEIHAPLLRASIEPLLAERQP